MIVPMLKYSFILYHRDYEAFLTRLQELGLVDITVSGWEPDEAERSLMTDIDNQRAAMKQLADLRKTEGYRPGKAFASPQETLAQTVAANAGIERLRGEQARMRKEIADAQPWGDFSRGELEQLAGVGVKLHFFTAPTREYSRKIEAWSEEYAVERIAEADGTVYFVIPTGADQPLVEIEANEAKMPARTAREGERELKRLEKDILTQQAILERAAEGMDALDEYGKQLREDLHRSQVDRMAPREAAGSLVLMEGWAPEEKQKQVDDFIAVDNSAYAVKSEPEEEDEPPVLLKNNRFARLFEPIGGFYSLPRYGTLDLTPWFAPFFMLFFGFCLADAGYGALYLIAAIIARFKLPAKLQGIVSLVMVCAVSTILFGLLTGNAFGIPLAEQPLFAGLTPYMLNSDQLFVIAIAVGVVQILLAMVLRIVYTVKYQGFKFAASSIGWLIVLLSVLTAVALPKLGVEIKGYTMGSIPFWTVTGIGLFMMLFLNSPGKNPFFNFGLGLWNTYNDVTSFVSDGLSYIRLFALGLSGGIQALVFNQLALEMSPDIVVVKQLIMVIILLIGQGITLFTATLSAFVHPLRLTFVEFYQNAGFADGGRAYRPLKKEE
jgi:V/A-type H+-transporting ATPase subunit I